VPGELGLIDSGILQFAPKGAYYEGKDEQYNAINSMWESLFKYDRTLFSLLMLLNGTGFAKGSMSHILLSNPLEESKLPVLDNLPSHFEKDIINYALYKERTPRALKNLLMLTGAEGHSKVNNSRTRKMILEFIFNRDNNNLDNLAVNYKGKLQTLITHALGKQDLAKILGGDKKSFEKFIGKYNRHSFPVVLHIFNMDIPTVGPYFPMIEKYYKLRNAAQEKNITEFKKLMKGFPERTVMGMRNLYKVNIPLSELKDETTKSQKDKIQGQAAAKRAGTKIDIDYKKQDIYDLFKFLYFKIKNNDGEDFNKILYAIDHAASKLPKIDIGECVVVMDASHSMMGSDERPMHPFLTGLSITATLKNIREYIYVGGETAKMEGNDFPEIVVPSNSTDLWRGLIKAVKTGVENIVIISDGYENTVKGMFKHVYDHLKKNGYKFKVTHINPVFSATSINGSTRKLADDIKSMPVGNYKYLETEVIFSKLIEDKEMVKKLLISKYRNLLQ